MNIFFAEESKTVSNCFKIVDQKNLAVEFLCNLFHIYLPVNVGKRNLVFLYWTGNGKTYFRRYFIISNKSSDQRNDVIKTFGFVRSFLSEGKRRTIPVTNSNIGFGGANICCKNILNIFVFAICNFQDHVKRLNILKNCTNEVLLNRSIIQ